jgi:hypothetical protein
MPGFFCPLQAGQSGFFCIMENQKMITGTEAIRRARNLQYGAGASFTLTEKNFDHTIEDAIC